MSLKLLLYFSCLFKILLGEQIPEYLSLTAPSNYAEPYVNQYIEESMIILGNIFNDELIHKDFIDLFYKERTPNSTFHNPDSWHVTCLYIGKNLSKVNTTIYKNFVEGIKYSIESYTIVYIPGQLILTPVRVEDFNLIENKYPHVTLMVGSLRAVDSNYVLRYIFEETVSGRDLYETGRLYDSDYFDVDKYKNAKIHFDDLGITKTIDEIYIIKMTRKFELFGITTKNYSTR